MPNPPVRPSANWSSSYTPTVVGAVAGQIMNTELAQLDAQLAGSINGDDGSAHAPPVQVEIDGNGMSVTGPTVVQQGATLVADSNPTIYLQQNDFPKFVNGNKFGTHPFMQPCFDAIAYPRTTWHVRREDAGLQAFSASFDLSDGLGQRGSQSFVRLRPHDGATLTSVTISFRVGYPHTKLPTAMPQVGVLKFAADGTLVGSLTSQAAGANVFGLMSVAKPVSSDAWYANGATQTLTIPCDQNNVIDVSRFFYRLQIVEESALTGYPWQLTYTVPVRLATGAPQVQFGNTAPVDGFTANEGDRVLCTGQSSATQNGIWIVHSQPGKFWTKAADITSSTFTRGMVVPVLQGKQNQGLFFQVLTTISSYSQGTSGRVNVWSAGIDTHSGPVIPTATNATGLWYTGSGTGTSGPTEPIWPTQVGDTVLDPNGSITWTAKGPDASPLLFAPRPDASNPIEGTGFIAHGIVWQSAKLTHSVADMRFA